MEKKYFLTKNACMCKTESLCCTEAIGTTLQINYTSIKKLIQLLSEGSPADPQSLTGTGGGGGGLVAKSCLTLAIP